MATNINSFKKWKELAKESDFRCIYCGCDLLSNEHIYASAVGEHFIPRSRGGAEVVVSCGLCNKVKRDRKFDSIEEARKELKRLRKEYLEKFEFYKLREQHRH
jgi:hypothetical protein